MKNLTFYEICMYIYSQIGEYEDEECKSIETLKHEVNKSLGKLTNMLHEKYEYDEAEAIITMVLDYAEKYANQLFIHGIEQGIMLCKGLNTVENTF